MLTIPPLLEKVRKRLRDFAVGAVWIAQIPRQTPLPLPVL